MAHRIHYEVNICGGDFAHVRECFRNWKTETLVYRRHHGELAHRALERVCDPADAYALAAEIRDGERDLWLVMAAFDEEV